MKSRNITLTAVFVATGIVLPQMFHLIGGPSAGQVFLPMHISVFIAGMLLGVLPGLLVAVISLLIGVMLGMPQIPFASYMVFELSVYAIVVGFMYYKKKFNIYVSLITAMILGRFVALSVIYLYTKMLLFSYPPLIGTIGMFSVGLPGMIIQILIIPVIVRYTYKAINQRFN
jgi:niacin transporter